MKLLLEKQLAGAVLANLQKCPTNLFLLCVDSNTQLDMYPILRPLSSSMDKKMIIVEQTSDSCFSGVVDSPALVVMTVRGAKATFSQFSLDLLTSPSPGFFVLLLADKLGMEVINNTPELTHRLDTHYLISEKDLLRLKMNQLFD